MTRKLVGLVLAKSQSKRLPEKNNLDFHGRPMFLVNVEKLFNVCDEVYVSSESKKMLKLAESIGAKGILRPQNLCGDVPNITVYKECLKSFPDATGIIAVQACSPNVSQKLVFTTRGLLELGYEEVMTCHPLEHDINYHKQSSKIYGSIWALSTNKLKNYEDPYKPTPDILLVDTSEDIHYQDDYEMALKNYPQA